jgi:beta-glucanase (GH16 family)
MTFRLPSLLLCALAGRAMAAPSAPFSPANIASEATNLTLVWHDEFDGPTGAAPDPIKWVYDLGASGWGNHELEEYTGSRQNSAMNGKGQLVITARKDAAGRYTSARLKTQGTFSFQYGRIEARIKVPKGQGIWPAFWMLGEGVEEEGWPACGEIDIMENIGKEPRIIHGSVHGPGYSGGQAITAQTELAVPGTLADDFHVYALDWSPNRLEFSLDGKIYQTVTPASMPPNSKWVFNQHLFLLLNVAVGGDWPGNPDATTQFPQEMLVDYVRFYNSVSVKGSKR